MSRYILITAGITLILLMIGLWVYLIAYGAPEKPREIFSNLGVLSSGEEVRIVEPEVNQNSNVQLSLTGSPLQQLTTRAVAGFTFLPGEGKILRYVERGTGYAFEIDLSSGTEKQVSLTTVSQTREATFSPEGTRVVLTTYEGNDQTIRLGSFTAENELELEVLPDGTENVAFDDEDTLYYTVEEGGVSVAYALDIQTGKRSEKARIPFANADMIWGEGITGMHTFPKPSALFESALYNVSGGTLTPVSLPQFGLTAFGMRNILISSALEGNTYRSTAHIGKDKERFAFFMIPEKCAFNTFTGTEIWCASALVEQGNDDLGDWYKGTKSFEDHLWITDIGDLTTSYSVSLTELGGRVIDVDGMQLNATGELMLIRNKIDGALWVYKIPIAESEETTE
jgi:hypothetical protein